VPHNVFNGNGRDVDLRQNASSNGAKSATHCHNNQTVTSNGNTAHLGAGVGTV